MEKPSSTAAEDIRDEKVKVLKAMAPLRLEDIALGQYVADPDAKPDAEAAKGYKDDATVPPDSVTPTYALAVARINSERWEGSVLSPFSPTYHTGHQGRRVCESLAVL